MKNHEPSSTPTIYRGIQMRSRLEATWAAFFDLLGWHWEYEPRYSRVWTPDFSLEGVHGDRLYVEVRPVIRFPQPTAEQIDASSFTEEALILGERPNPMDRTGPCQADAHPGLPPLGWMREQSTTDGQWIWETAHFHSLAGVGFHPGRGEFFNRITFARDGLSGAFAEQIPSFAIEIYESWIIAKNALQYRSAHGAKWDRILETRRRQLRLRFEDNWACPTG